MIIAYRAVNGHLELQELEITDSLPDKVVWLDVSQPTDEERDWLDQYFRDEAPEAEDLVEIEATSRFFTDEQGLHILSVFPHKSGRGLKNINVSFYLRSDFLISLRDTEVGIFRLVRAQIKRNSMRFSSRLNPLFALFSAKIDTLADTLEEVYEALENVSSEALDEKSNLQRQELLREVTLQEDIIGKIRLNLMDTQRSLRFLYRELVKKAMSEKEKRQLKEMIRDIDSLLPHTDFLFEKVNFLLDAILGFINHDQNTSIKLFSVVAVLFLPATLVASVYGMNFEFMPELDKPWGYPFALGLMGLSAMTTLVLFKVKKWL